MTVWGADQFNEMLVLADVVVASVPDTPEARGMFDAEAFRRMQKHAIIIAVGRGRTIDTEALVAALRVGDIAGAGLDVVHPEPLPIDHPLWRMDNVIVTPHIAGHSPERGAPAPVSTRFLHLFPRQQRKPWPPPKDFLPFPAEAKLFDDLGRCRRGLLSCLIQEMDAGWRSACK